MRRWRGKTSPQGSRRTVVWSKYLFGLATRTCTHVGKKKVLFSVIFIYFLDGFHFLDLLICKRISLQLKSHESLHMLWNTERKELRNPLKFTLSETVFGGHLGNNWIFLTHNSYSVQDIQYEIYLHCVLAKCCNSPWTIAWWDDRTALFLFNLHWFLKISSRF